MTEVKEPDEMVSVVDVLCLLLVSVLWGATNPFLKKGTEGIEHIRKGNVISQFLAEAKFLFLNIKYLVPFLLNQSGSVVFYLTLATTDLSLAVPTVNSLSLVFTMFTGKLLGEECGGKSAVLGMMLITAGVMLCVLISVSESNGAGLNPTP
ncbi:transmembrane protein 234 [Tachysurus ichikawai]